MDKKIVEVKNFKMKFGDHEVIKDLSFDIKKGEVFALLGSNGSGKTTTLRALLNMHQATSGELLINGKKFVPNKQINIGYLPEERGLYKKEKVIYIMRYFAELKGLSRDEADKFIEKYLERVELKGKEKTRLDKLSSGQQQKIQLGITIMGNPELMILDEPTKGFDPVNRRLLMEIIEEERRKGTTIIMITHHMEEVERLCDRVLLLKDGVAKAYGTVDEIKQKAGKNVIEIDFEGEFPINESLYEIENQQNNFVKLIPKTENNQNILKYLVDQKLQIKSFNIKQPSLEDIFVKIYGYSKEKSNG